MKSWNSARTACSIVASPALVLALFAGSLLEGGSDRPAAPAAPVAAAQPVAFPAGTSAADVAQAQLTTTTLANAVVSAVVTISDASPPDASLAQIQAGSAAVTALLPPCGKSYGLIDASGDPLDMTNFPQGAFEVAGMQALLGGAPAVQEVVGSDLRTMVPLTNDMHPNCTTCHTNYDQFAPGTVIGAASFRIKL